MASTQVVKGILLSVALVLSQAGFSNASSYHERVDPIAVFSGDGYERGLQQGRLWRDEIIENITAVFNTYFPSVLYRQWAYVQAMMMQDHIPQGLINEMKGIADATGIPYRNVLVGNLVADLGQLALMGMACSSFLATGERGADDGDPTGMIYGRNLDWYHDLAPLMRENMRPMIFAAPRRKKVLSIGMPGMVGVLSGINEERVAMSVMYSWHSDQGADGFPITLLYRYALSRADDVTSAKVVLELTPRTIASNTLLADGVSAAILEMTASLFEERNPALGVLYAANHFESRPLLEGQPPGRDYRWPALSRHDRSDIPLELEEVRQVIAAAAMDDDAFINVKAFLIDFERDKLYWGTGGPPAAGHPMEEIDLGAIFP